MRILFVVDGRSQIAQNWIAAYSQPEHEVHLVSTFQCSLTAKFASFQVIPVAFSDLKRLLLRRRHNGAVELPIADHSKAETPAWSVGPKGMLPGTRQGIWGANLVGLRTSLRQWLGPLTLSGAARKLAETIQQLQPDMVHAMRIPYEGMLAALAKERLGRACPPLLISVWGNDFTLHARSTPWMAALTRQALSNTDALHSDCMRDLRLASEWGFDPALPAIVLPGAGGVQTDLFYPSEQDSDLLAPVVINPRGVRAYVRNDTFFKAIPLVLAQCPQARFICSSMAGETQSRRWVEQYGIRNSVDLLPKVSRIEMADFFRKAQVAVSPSTHDGTPNTLLEAMACGCFPVAGDLESLREWITQGKNGLLVDPGDAQALAGAILQAIGDAPLRQQAKILNLSLVYERAEYGKVMQQAKKFYSDLVQHRKNSI